MPKIEIRCKGSGELALEDIHDFQGELKILSEENYQKGLNLMLELGFSFPFAVWTQRGKAWCLDGHQRKTILARAREEGVAIPALFPVVEVAAKDRAEAKRKLLAAVSQLAQVAGPGLAEFLVDAKLSFPDFRDQFVIPELDLEAFRAEYYPEVATVAEHDRRLAGGQSNADDAFDPPAEAQARLGDLFVLGRHRLLCGDCTKPEDVQRLMGTDRAALMNTDPPYGVSYVTIAQEKGQAQKLGEIANDSLEDEKLQDFLEAAFKSAAAHALTSHAAWYMWHAHLTQGFFAAAAAANVMLHRQIIWVKPSLVFGRGQYHWRHEPCFMGWVKGNMPPFYGERNQTTIWEMGRENDKIHPTQKPVELFRRPLINHTKKAEICYEPFAGSGSQIIAAEELDRRCFAMELEPRYIDAILNRWGTFTGQDPTLEDGTPWSEIQGKSRKRKSTRKKPRPKK